MTPTLGRAASLVLPDPVPYLIVSRGRTGSSLLGSLLNSHPRVAYYAEVFGEGVIEQPDVVAEIRRRGTVDYLKQFYRREAFETATGVKFLYYQVERPYEERYGVEGLSAAMDYVKSRPDIRILHVKRTNRLATFASIRAAYLSQQYVLKDENKRKVKTVELDPDKCEAEFRRIGQWEERFDRELADHPLLQVEYEALAANMQAEGDRVLNFLGLPPRELSTKMIKQRKKPLRESIANYAELEARFRGTEWAKYFDE